MAYVESFGTTIQIGDGVLSTTPTYTTIGQVKELEIGAFAHTMADVTHHSSTNGAFEQIPSGKRDEIEITMTIVYDPDLATHTNSSGGLYHTFDNKTPLAYKINLTDTTPSNFTFDGYVKSFQPTVGDGSEALMAEVVIGVTGSVTLA
jgi:hypothetical protein